MMPPRGYMRANYQRQMRERREYAKMLWKGKHEHFKQTLQHLTKPPHTA